MTDSVHVSVCAGMGGKLRAPSGGLLFIRQSGGPQSLPALRLFVLPRILLQPERTIHEGKSEQHKGVETPTNQFTLIFPHRSGHFVCSLSLVSRSCVSVAVLRCPCSDSYCGGSSSTRRPPSTQTLTAWKETPSVSRLGNACCQSRVIKDASINYKPINTRNAAACPFNSGVSF